MGNLEKEHAKIIRRFAEKTKKFRANRRKMMRMNQKRKFYVFFSWTLWDFPKKAVVAFEFLNLPGFSMPNSPDSIRFSIIIDFFRFSNGHQANDDGNIDDSEVIETALEKRYRLAKEYLKRVEDEGKRSKFCLWFEIQPCFIITETEKTESQEVDHDAIAHRLKEDAVSPCFRRVFGWLILRHYCSWNKLDGYKERSPMR